METMKFDAVARLVGIGATRRQAVRGLLAGAAAVAVGGVSLDAALAVKGEGKKKRCLKAGKPCTSNKQCCPDKTKRICAVPTGGSSSDEYCTGGLGAKCGGANIDGDAVGLKCSANLRCSTGDPDAPGFQPNTPGTCVRS